MKKISAILLSLILISTGYAFAQDNFKRALDNFHQTLAFTYHPMMDDSNFSPIKAQSHELAERATAIETAFNSEKDQLKGLENAVSDLSEECTALDEAIKKEAKDEVIRARLSEIHDHYHQLEELYNRIGLNGK